MTVYRLRCRLNWRNEKVSESKPQTSKRPLMFNYLPPLAMVLLWLDAFRATFPSLLSLLTLVSVIGVYFRIVKMKISFGMHIKIQSRCLCPSGEQCDPKSEASHNCISFGARYRAVADKCKVTLCSLETQPVLSRYTEIVYSVYIKLETW